jgi:hypothetical protein
VPHEIDQPGCDTERSGGMTGMARLRARQQAARLLMEQYQAELAGLVHAELSATSVLYSYVPELQAAFERGLREGRDILTVHAAAAEQIGA